MTYDQWKTTDPADNVPVCECCGGYLRGFLSDYCDTCASEEEMMEFFSRWEPA